MPRILKSRKRSLNMGYYSRLAYDIWERENYYAEDDCSPPWEEPASVSPSDQEEDAPLAA